MVVVVVVVAAAARWWRFRCRPHPQLPVKPLPFASASVTSLPCLFPAWFHPPVLLPRPRTHTHAHTHPQAPTVGATMSRCLWTPSRCCGSRTWPRGRKVSIKWRMSGQTGGTRELCRRRARGGGREGRVCVVAGNGTERAVGPSWWTDNGETITHHLTLFVLDLCMVWSCGYVPSPASPLSFQPRWPRCKAVRVFNWPVVGCNW